MIIRTMSNHIKEASLGKSKLDRCIRHSHAVHIGIRHMLPVAFQNCTSVL